MRTKFGIDKNDGDPAATAPVPVLLFFTSIPHPSHSLLAPSSDPSPQRLVALSRSLHCILEIQRLTSFTVILVHSFEISSSEDRLSGNFES
jgi:hypothetical protein